MSAFVFPGPIYAIGHDPHPADPGDFIRNLLRINSGGTQCVVLYSDRAAAHERARVNPDPDSDAVLKPFAFTDADEFVMFLQDLETHGVSHVGFDPSGRAFKAVGVRDLLLAMGRSNPRHGDGRHD